MIDDGVDALISISGGLGNELGEGLGSLLEREKET